MTNIKFIFYKILFLFIILYSGYSKSYTISEEISDKYFSIFSKEVLKKEDIDKYKKIFILQEDCKWKEANKKILTINNKILLGHVLAQRYLHPRCYRSKFIELSSWLKRYNDHPQAKRIYRLAIRRMPEGYKRPKQPSKVVGIETNLLEKKTRKKYKSSKKLNKNQRLQKNKLINSIKYRVNKGWPTGAVKLLNQRDVNILLDQVEIDQQKELIAKGYFLADKNNLAIKYASEAVKNSGAYVPYANWTAGLSAWRLKDYRAAAKFFTDFSLSLEDDEWHKSSGSFWAARSYAELNEYKEINFWLKKSAVNANSFYGILANRILGVPKPIDWNFTKTDSNIEQKISSLPSGNRIKALIQVGLLNELENEIIKLNSTMNKDVAMWSLDIAQSFNLAYTQLKITGRLAEYGITLPIRYSYPLPLWKPKNGFNIEPALIYAFMHQESRFNSTAKSHQGAMGLMQIMPSTAKYISTNKQVKRNNSNILKIPEINIEVGQEYIEYLLELKPIKKNLIFLTAAYNGGPGNLKKWQENTNYLNDPLLFMESIPSRETRWFIEKVLTKYWVYSDKLGKNANSLEMLANGESPIYK